MSGPRSGRPASTAGWLTPSQRHAWATSIREALREDPTLTATQLVEVTGAPPTLCRQVRQRWAFLGEVSA